MDRIRGKTKSTLTFTDAQRVELEEVSGLLTAKQVASHFGISYNTLLNMFAREPEIQQIFDRGRAKTTQIVANALIQKAKAGDVQAAKFYLERMAGWHETTLVQQETKQVKKFSDMYDDSDVDDDNDDGGEEE